MISYWWSLDPNVVVKIIHDFTPADELGWLDPTLKLVTRIQVQCVALIFFAQNVNKLSHIDESPICVLLSRVLSHKGSRKGLPMDIIGADDGHSKLSDGILNNSEE